MIVFRILALVIISMVFIGCGGKQDKKKEGFSYEKTSEGSENVANDPNNVVITGNDAMQFNIKEIKVKAGKKVKVTLRHIGKMDVKVMGHNFVLLKQGVNLIAFGNKAATARGNNYIPVDSKDIIAHTKMLGGGGSAVIEFHAPEVGAYDFLCSFPGHYGLMKGKFIVE